MKFNHNFILFIYYLTSLLITKHVSCVPTKFLSFSSISPSPSPKPSITTLEEDLEKPISKLPQKIQEACEKTDYPLQCSNSIAHFLEGKIEPYNVLNSEAKAFDLALEVAEDDISNNFKDDKAASTCKEMYQNAREEIAKAMYLASKNDKYGVNIMLSAALTFIETCKDELPTDVKDDSSMFRANKLLSNLASNCLALGQFAFGSDDSDLN